MLFRSNLDHCFGALPAKRPFRSIARTINLSKTFPRASSPPLFPLTGSSRPLKPRTNSFSSACNGIPSFCTNAIPSKKSYFGHLSEQPELFPNASHANSPHLPTFPLLVGVFEKKLSREIFTSLCRYSQIHFKNGENVVMLKIRCLLKIGQRICVARTNNPKNGNWNSRIPSTAAEAAALRANGLSPNG